MYELPENWETFYDEMHGRAYEYISIGYWGIKEETLTLWLKNFSTEHEKFLAGLLIYRLLYRNEEPQLSMYHHIIDMILPSILAQYDIYHISSLQEFHNELKRNPWLPFRFSTIEGVDSQPAKSGHTVLRNFQRNGSFHKELEVSKSTIGDLDTSVVKAIILFDDFMGTGEQFDTYLQSIEKHLKEFKFIYCPLAAHSAGIEFITNKYKNVIISPVEILDERYAFNSPVFMPKLAEDIDMITLEEFYINFLKSKTKLRKNFLGKEEQSLSYIFNLSTPNNSLPIFSYEDDNFHKLFSR